MGVVFKAQDETLDEMVALKFLRPDLTSHGDLARGLRTETKLARSVRHKNVCGIHEYGEDGRLVFISMEYVDGRNLRQILRQGGPPDWETAYDIALQAADGLAAIHGAGVIHRDLKPANIMIDSKDVVRLMDFGIAKVVNADIGSTAHGRVVGSPEYMSPEQVRDWSLDFRSDIYSFGVVLFELFTGRVPFRGDSPAATILKHLEEPPPLHGPLAMRLHPAMVPILERALAKDREARYGTCAEMRRDLERARDRDETPDLLPAAPAPPRSSPVRLLVPWLLRALQLPDAAVRRDAAEILGTVDGERQQIVEALRSAGDSDEDPAVRTTAGESLRRLGASKEP